MKLVISPGGTVTWNNTRACAINSSTFRKGTADFGAGAENTAECPGCSRVLPTVCMHLDHIKPRAKFTRTVFNEGEKFTVYQGNGANPVIVSKSFSGAVFGNVATIYKTASHNPTARQRALHGAGKVTTQLEVTGTARADTIWENDLTNLQFLCMSCNTGKGAGALAFTPAPLGDLLP